MRCFRLIAYHLLKARQSIRRPYTALLRGWPEAVEPPCPEVTTRGFSAKYSHRLCSSFLQALRILLFGVACGRLFHVC
jgi:hypothetical protein